MNCYRGHIPIGEPFSGSIAPFVTGDPDNKEIFMRPPEADAQFVPQAGRMGGHIPIGGPSRGLSGYTMDSKKSMPLESFVKVTMAFLEEGV